MDALAIMMAMTIMIQTVAVGQYNMYDTDGSMGDLQYDCLRYTVLDDIADYQDTVLLQHQFIMYCFRPTEHFDSKEEDRTAALSDENVFSALTFVQLKMRNITSWNLWTWSAPIDLIEHYAAYSIDHNADHERIFFNCTVPWFGPRCQYSFETNNTFSNVVKNTFIKRHISNTDPRNENGTCYIHLSCEHRSWGIMCLDWREICDGKIDCINGGIDEQNCLELEKNECEENEYRCQNGLCIPHQFLRDDAHNPECLDRTDEGYVTNYPYLCPLDPSFRCEEHSCKLIGRSMRAFPCGDGKCLSKETSCENKRGSWFHVIDMHFKMNDRCWMGMHCLTQIEAGLEREDFKRWCKNFSVSAAEQLIRRYCPSVFDFPSQFLLYGHVRFLYLNDHFNYFKDLSILPMYVCYRNDLCEFLPSTINVTMPNNDSLSCRYFHELNVTTVYKWLDIVSSVQKLFRVCSSIINSMHCSQETTSLFPCSNSKTCISKHRLVDAIRDCPRNEDEIYENSCALNDKDRFKCAADGRCLSPILVNDAAFDCRDYTDEEKKYDLEYKRRISFQTLCDGFVELTPVMVDGYEETDESRCEHWICNNPYNRCDGFWNCLNGEDELNCHSPSICQPTEHLCVSPITHNITCLPIEKINDNVTDCLGGTDERHYCRNKHPKHLYTRFLCRNTVDNCISTEHICDNESHCPQGDDERFCSIATKQGQCSTIQNNEHDPVNELLCNLSEVYKPVIVYFALQNFPNYPPSIPSVEWTSSYFVHPTSSPVPPSIWYFSSDSWPSIWRCNRGLNIRVRHDYRCLCPPSYYGNLCQYQNQRVSLTIQVRIQAEWHTMFTFLITLIDDNKQTINSYDQFSYLASRDCNTKFHLYLLYGHRPKDAMKNYSIRIDAFERRSFVHRAIWLYPIRFPFLPVHRMSAYLVIPTMMEIARNCKLNCNHGHCIRPVNDLNRPVCQCDHGWSGKQCHIKHKCNCSPQSLCIGSICLCPTGSFGPRCFLTQSTCASEPCQNDGQCIPQDFGRRSRLEYTCICKEGYSGDHCQHVDTRIEISFSSDMKIPSAILAHLIAIHPGAHPTRRTVFGKIGFNENRAVLFTDFRFRLIFVQFHQEYYFAYHQSTQSYRQSISTMIQVSHQCKSTSKLFNSTIRQFHTLRRLKYYQLPCEKHRDLVCFYDSVYICLCTTDRYANCLEFDQNITYNCQGRKICANGADCFDDNPVCPTTSMCVCKDCFYGSRCQYSTTGFDLSLDIILDYHIHANIPFSQQPAIVQVSITIVTLMFVIGLTSGVLSILTFRSKNSQKVGCGIYLLTSAIVSIVVVIILSWRMISLILAQTKLITERTFLSMNCVITDFLLHIFLYVSDWLSACVAIERAIAIIRGPYFDLQRSKRVSKYSILIVFLLTIASALPDLFHRQLVDDLEDDDTWCIINYSDSFAFLNSLVIVFHFATPFTINILSALLIIIMTARRRISTQKQFTGAEHFRSQLQQHRHLLISPCILVLLALPRLVLSFFSGCMSSTRDSWFFLIGYFISFVPPILTFFIFVLPSKTYKSEFLLSINKVRSVV